MGKIEAVGSLLAPVSPDLDDVQEGRVRHGHCRCVLRLRLGGMCPYSAIHVRVRRHRRVIGDKALEHDAGDGGPLEWEGVSGLGKGRLRGNRHPGVARDLRWRCVLSSMSILVFPAPEINA